MVPLCLCQTNLITLTQAELDSSQRTEEKGNTYSKYLTVNYKLIVG